MNFEELTHIFVSFGKNLTDLSMYLLGIGVILSSVAFWMVVSTYYDPISASADVFLEFFKWMLILHLFGLIITNFFSVVQFLLAKDKKDKYKIKLKSKVKK